MAAPRIRRHWERLPNPVYGFYGENDNRINSTIESTKEAAKSADVTYEPVIYSGVGHGFLRRGMAAEASEVQKTVTLELGNDGRIY